MPLLIKSDPSSSASCCFSSLDLCVCVCVHLLKGGEDSIEKSEANLSNYTHLMNWQADSKQWRHSPSGLLGPKSDFWPIYHYQRTATSSVFASFQMKWMLLFPICVQQPPGSSLWLFSIGFCARLLLKWLRQSNNQLNKSQRAGAHFFPPVIIL